MEPKKFITKINMRQLARDLGISIMTLYRVLNNEPTVRPATRKRVIDALNKRGYYANQETARKIVVDFSNNRYLLFFGTLLLQQLSNDGFTIIATNHREKRIAFLDAIADAETVVYCSEPDENVVAEVKKANPNIFSISMFGTALNTDIILRCNDVLGCSLAAQHLHRLGHRRHIAVHKDFRHKDADRRIFLFCAEMKRLAPDCRIDILEQRSGDLSGFFRNYFFEQNKRPTAILFVMCYSASLFRLAVLPNLPDEMKNIGVMSYDSIVDMNPAGETDKLDRVDFSMEELLRWMEYLLNNRPMLGCRNSVEISINMELFVENSVPDITKEISNHKVKKGQTK